MTDYVLTDLVKRRAELAGQIEATHAELRRIVDALENLDQTIWQFDPGHNVEGIRPKAFRPPKDWANRGQMSRRTIMRPVSVSSVPEPSTLVLLGAALTALLALRRWIRDSAATAV